MKENRSVYRGWTIFFCVFLAIGAFLFVYSVATGYGMDYTLSRALTV